MCCSGFFFFQAEDGIRDAQEFCVLKQKTAYEMLRSLVGSEMCIRDRLSIPTIRYGIGLLSNPSENKEGKFYRIIPLAMIVVLIVVPCLTYGSHFKYRPEYPFTQNNLPAGVAKFLNSIDALSLIHIS